MVLRLGEQLDDADPEPEVQLVRVSADGARHQLRPGACSYETETHSSILRPGGGAAVRG
jgi:hypothetical protein